MQILIRDGRHVDDSLAPVWAKLSEEGLAGMTMLGRHLLETAQLRDGIDLGEVRDVLWNTPARPTPHQLHPCFTGCAEGPGGLGRNR